MTPIKPHVRAPKGKPREPLFTIREIGARFGVEWTRLRALMSAYPASRPEPVFNTTVTGSSAMAKMYRVSATPKPIYDNALHMMESFGGGFVKSLAACYYCADSENRRKLRAAFREYFERYEQLFREHVEQRKSGAHV